jgi:hypothetical protein
MNSFPIANTELDKIMGLVSKLQQFLPTPSSVLRDLYTPETLTPQQIFFFHPCYPLGTLTGTLSLPDHKNLLNFCSKILITSFGGMKTLDQNTWML